MQMFNVRSAMRLKAAVADSHYRPRSKKKKLEGTHRVRTHAVNPNHNFDL